LYLEQSNTRLWGWNAWRLGVNFRMVLALNIIVGLFVLSLPGTETIPVVIWGVKPVIGYLVLTPRLAQAMSSDISLDQASIFFIQSTARHEMKQLHSLELESRSIVKDSGLSLSQKRERISAMGYNRRVQQVIETTQEKLRAGLGSAEYADLVKWVERRWDWERRVFGMQAGNASARTYRVYATRYDSKGAYSVALPDKCLKFTNAGNSLCADDGYQVGQTYSVFISYQGGVGGTVGESGPWNVDDNYWATRNDPTPRRMFADLPLGMPEAQAAYFNGYNGGKDQFGRTVTAPYGIDLARQVSIDIGLQPGVNDWIDVSFLWTEGWDGSSPKIPPGSAVAVPQGATALVIVPVQVATADRTGEVVHEVQPGQTLLGIAAAYDVSLGEILRLNNMDVSTIIVPGNLLLIRIDNATQDITKASSTKKVQKATKILQPGDKKTSKIASISSGTPDVTETSEPTQTSTRSPIGSGEIQSQANVTLLVIAVMLGVGVILLVIGGLLKHEAE